MDDNEYTPSEEDLKKIDELSKNESDKIRIRPKSRPKSKSERKQLNSVISSVLSEFVDTYLLCAFDTEGNPIVLISASSNMETRALGDLLEEFVTKSFDNFDIDQEYDDEDQDDDEDQ